MRKSIFYKLFPTPVFITMPSIGLDISDDAIRFVELSNKKNELEIENYGEIRLDAGIVVEGKILKKDKLQMVIKKIAEKYNFKFANVSLPEEQAYVALVEVPKMKKNEIRSNLEFQIEEHVPIPTQEAVFDYDIISTTSDKKDNKIDLILSALPNDIAMSYAGVFENTGITPLYFEIESQAISRSVIQKGDSGTFMIVDFEKSKTSISIVSKEIVSFTSSLSIGEAALTSAIKKSLNLSDEEVERIKTEKGFSTSDSNQALALSMIPSLATLRDEINKHGNYWHSHTNKYGEKRPKIEKFIFCGAGANIPGVKDYIASGLNIDMELANPLVNINSLNDYIPDLSFEDSLRYVTALGLAIYGKK